MIELFVIDPPWPRKKGGLRKVRPNQDRNLCYETCSVDEIFNILDTDIFSQASNLHCVFLWAIDKFLIDAEVQMRQRGYRQHCRIIWDKENGVAPAFTVRYSHEYLLWFYKPNLPKIDLAVQGKLTTVWREAAREHSRKPEISYRNIELLYPTLTKMDVFSRQKREGWCQYGDQIDFF